MYLPYYLISNQITIISTTNTASQSHILLPDPLAGAGGVGPGAGGIDGLSGAGAAGWGAGGVCVGGCGLVCGSIRLPSLPYL